MKILLSLLILVSASAWSQVLPSWNDGAAKQGIAAFVQAVSDKKSGSYVQPAERIAVFDNDGTLWAEQPMYFQEAFLIDQAKAAVAKRPEWKDKSERELLALANSGMTVSAYDKTIRGWLATARHPRFNRPYTDLVYKPMQELLAYLRANGFKTFIVSGGGIEFMRAWTEQAYGIPPEQVVGSVAETKFDGTDLARQPKVAFVDDGPGKPVGIYRHIGRRPLAAFGNSDGDLQMLQYTAAGSGKRLMLLVHHDDAEREYAYDRQSQIGKLDKALDEAKARNWIVISMKSDWKRVFSFEGTKP